MLEKPRIGWLFCACRRDETTTANESLGTTQYVKPVKIEGNYQTCSALV